MMHCIKIYSSAKTCKNDSSTRNPLSKILWKFYLVMKINNNVVVYLFKNIITK